MRPDDADEVADLLGQLGYPTTPLEARRRLERGGEEVIVAEHEGTLTGLIAIARLEPLVRERPVARVTALIVNRLNRREGVGRELIQEALRRAREAGCEGVELTSGMRAERAPAHRFYSRLGFAKTSYRFWFPLGED